MAHVKSYRLDASTHSNRVGSNPSDHGIIIEFIEPQQYRQALPKLPHTNFVESNYE